MRLPQIDFTKSTLSNGLDVLVRRQGPLPIVAVNLWYHVGSKNEERRQRGFAHLFEHLMFEGSQHYPGDFFKPLQRLGAGVNGSTSADRTNYYVDLPVSHLELALAMESDRMGNLLPALSDSKLRIQKDVVKNEYRQNYANRPYGQVPRLMAEALYPPTHPYSWLTIGVMEDVEAASRDDVEAFFKRFYVPANASLAIVGQIDPHHALDLANRYFGDFPGGSSALPPWTPEVYLSSDRKLVFHDQVALDRLQDSWHTTPHFHPDDAPLALLADILGHGRSSRLYQTLVLDRQIAQNLSIHQSARELAGTFGILATIRPGRSLDEARDLIFQEIQNIATQGVTEDELQRVLNGREAGFIFALDNVGGFGGVADRLNAYNVHLGDPARITTDLARYQQVTSQEIARVAAHYLHERPRVSLDVLGRKTAKITTTPPPPLDRSRAPASGPPTAFQAPQPQIRLLSTGAPLFVLPRRDLPIVAATAVVRAGAATHHPSLGGLAHLTAAMLDEGTTTRTAALIAQAADSRGISLSASSGYDGAYVSVQCLSQHLEPSLELAADLLLNPTFPDSEWNRLRGQARAALAAESDSAPARAERAFLAALFSPDHPYHVPTEGSLDSLDRLNLTHLAGFHQQRFRPDQAAWVVAGDIDPDHVTRLLEALTSGWTGASMPGVPCPEASFLDAPRLLLLDRPGASQAVLRAGHPSLPRNHPDYADLAVFNQILGGQFTSRLNESLRETKGYTYGVRSRFDHRRDSGLFSISSSLESERLAEAVDTLRQEVVALLDDHPPSLHELDNARRALIEAQCRHFETPSELVARYGGLFIQNLPTDEYVKLPARLEAVSLQSVLQAGQRHLRPDSFLYVIVADANRVLEPLSRLAWVHPELFAAPPIAGTTPGPHP